MVARGSMDNANTKVIDWSSFTAQRKRVDPVEKSRLIRSARATARAGWSGLPDQNDQIDEKRFINTGHIEEKELTICVHLPKKLQEKISQKFFHVSNQIIRVNRADHLKELS